MTIQVRVMSAQALARLKQIQMQSNAAATSVNRVGLNAARGIPALSKWGNQIQWAGRQLMYNFTLPIALAIGAATKFALANQKAMTRVTKVYGDGSRAFRRLSKTEIPALAQAFEALSNQFAVNQAEVINIGADWAAAGSSGIALAKAVKLTLETMVLGELDAADATKQLIAIQAQYGMTVGQLSKTIDIFNMVENQTGASMKDLMDATSRTAGVARAAGVDIEHLSAMVAQLVPSAGSAATAGNALKTIFSRILSPTKEAKDLMYALGVNTDSFNWNAKNGVQRLEVLSKSFQHLSSAQKTHMATILGSRWQLNRLIILMQGVRNENSYYNKSLRATADTQKVFNQRQYELQKVLTSNPQMMRQAWVIIQNSITKAVVPLIPFIVYMAQEVAKLAHAFANLPGPTQKFALAALVVLALIGPLARYIGAVANLMGLMTEAVAFAGRSFIFFGKTMFLPFTLMGKMAGGLIANVAKAFLLLAFTLGGPMTLAMKKLSIIFFGAGFWRSIYFAMARGFAGLVTVMIAGLTPLLAPVQTFLRAILAMWLVMFGRIRNAFFIFGAILRAQMIAIGIALTKTTETMGTIWLRVWAGIQTMFVATMAMTRTVLVGLWAAIYLTGVAFLGGLQRVAAYAMLGVEKMGAGIIAVFTRLPAIIGGLMVSLGATIMTVWKGILVGIARLAPLLIRAFTGPWGIAITAAIGIMYAFRDKIAAAWHGILNAFHNGVGAIPRMFSGIGNFFTSLGKHIMDVFWQFPTGVRNAMVAVVTVVRDAALAVYDWLSYINPFAHHSPSLVESVDKGMQAVGRHYNKARNIGQGFKQAAKHLADFKKVANKPDPGQPKVTTPQQAKQDQIGGKIKNLTGVMKDQEAAVNRQQHVVDAWKNKLDSANSALDKQQKILDNLQKNLQGLQDRYSKASDAMEAYASAPIKGMGAMQDKIDANSLAQKKLQLQMMKWEQVNGSIDSVKDRLSSLHGDIEMLAGQANDLRMKGAGSDVLAPITNQIKALEDQAAATTKAVNNSPIDKMQQKMDQLQKQGDIMQLQYDIKYDPLTKSIDKLAHAQKELSYGTIVRGINKQKDAMHALQPQIDRATAAVDRQQKAVDRATNVRDRISNAYDREDKQLQKLQDTYGKTKDRVDKLTGALGDLKKASDALDAKKADKLKAAAAKAAAANAKAGSIPDVVKTFNAGKGANWADVGGKAKIGREGGMGDQSAQIKAFAEQSSNEMGKIFGTFDMWAPLKQMWNTTWNWIKQNVGPVVTPIVKAIQQAFKSINPFSMSGKADGAIKNVRQVWDKIVKISSQVGDQLKMLWGAFGPSITRTFDAIVAAGKQIWTKLGPDILKLADSFWKIIKVVSIVLMPIILMLAEIFSRVLGPALDMIIDVVDGVAKMFSGLVDIIYGALTLNTKMIQDGWIRFFRGLWTAVWGIFNGAVQILWGIVSGMVMGIWRFFKWLYDELIGHSIIPDIVNGIFRVFRGLIKLAGWIWNHVLKPVYHAFVAVWRTLIHPFLAGWFNLVKGTLNVLFKLGKWVWDHILKPVWNVFSALWKKWVRPFLAGWWKGIRAEWNGLFKLGKWVWDHILKPVWNFFSNLWRKYVRPFLAGWWKGIRAEWNALFKLGKWVWDHVLKPVFEWFKDLWRNKVRPELQAWWGRLTNAWHRLQSLGNWIKHNVMNPIFGAFRDGWNNIKSWFRDHASDIVKPIGSAVKGVISAINWMIKGLNKLDSLPGVKIHINTIDAPNWLASGGIPKRKVGSGFMTNGARAIVGEGKANWPEYVIPTDPTYRKRAKSLLMSAGKKLGYDVPMFAGGGIIDHIKSAAGSAAHLAGGALGWMKGNIQKLASIPFKAFKALANKAIGLIKWDVGRQVARGALDQVTSFVGNVDKALYSKAKDVKAAQSGGGNVPVPDPRHPGQHVFWQGGEFSNRFYAHLLKAQQIAHAHMDVMQGGFRPATSYSGTSHQGDAVDIHVNNALIRALRRVGIAAGDRTGLGNWAPHVHAVPGPSAGYAAGSAVWQFQDYMARGGMNQALNSPWGLAHGAIIRATRGGTNVQIGEGNNDEAVIPLPKNWKNGKFGGGEVRVFHFHGDLSFPNISDPNDVEKLIDNLILLAKD